jgi:multidrug resistance efflux pump
MKTHISTDDAYIDGYVHTITPKILGTVKALHIRDNQLVREGDLLLEIEPQDYVVAVRQALRALEAGTTKLAQIVASLEVGQSNLKLREARKHPYELYLELNDIEHTKTKAKSPETHGICERVPETILNEFYRVAFRKKIYPDLETLQIDLDEYRNGYNTHRTHQGKRCQGRTPIKTFLDGKRYFREKNLDKMLAT